MILCVFRRIQTPTNELWKTDGTATGTVMVKDIRSGSSSSVEGNILQRQVTLFNNTLYFQADDGTNGKEIVEERWDRFRNGDGQKYSGLDQ